MKVFKLELRRVIFNKWTGLAFIAGLVMCFIPLWDKFTYMSEFYEMNSNGADKVLCTATPYDNWLLFEQMNSMHYLYLFIMPLLAALPFGASYYMDSKTGYIKQLVSRCGIRKYVMAKYGATFISGGTVVSLPLLIQLMLLALIYPVNKPQRFDSVFFCETAPGIDLFFEHPIIYCIIWCAIVFIVAGLFAVISIAVTDIAYNYFSIIITPFVFAFLLIFLVYATEINEISFLYSICAVTNYSYNYWIFIGELTGMFLLTFIPFVLRKKEVL